MRRGKAHYGRLIADHIGVYARNRHALKPLLQQATEMLALMRHYHYPPYHYIKHHMYLEDFEGDPCDFVPPVLLRRFILRVNSIDSRTRVFDKVKFAEIVAAAGLPGVPTLAVIDRDRSIRCGRAVAVSYAELVRALTTEGRRTVFIKPVFGVNGTSVFRVEVDPIRGFSMDGSDLDEDTLLEMLFERRGEAFDRFLIQPEIRQHRVLDAINPASVNTVRIDSLLLDGEVEINGAVLRIGSGKTFTDNWSTGGMIAPIDLATGRLGASAKTKASFRRDVVDRHPVTGHPFDGVTIPMWGDVKALVHSAARALQPLRYLGWDIAISEHGPVIIEANHPSDIYLLQEGVGGLRRTRLGLEVMESRLA